MSTSTMREWALTRGVKSTSELERLTEMSMGNQLLLIRA